MKAAMAPQEQRNVQREARSTQHRQGGRFHIVYDDISDICHGSVRMAHAARAFERTTDQRIEALRREHDIPAEYMPAEDDLWLTMPYRTIEALTLRCVSKSLCQHLIGDEDPQRPSLISLGFLRRRAIARPGTMIVTRPEYTTVYRDEISEFIVIDESGEYMGVDDKRHAAADDGYTLIDWQYLYCFDKVNAAIADFDGFEAPEPLPRWSPTIPRWEPGGKLRRAKKSIAVGPSEETTISPMNGDENDNYNPTRRRDTNVSSFENNHSTQEPKVSRNDDTFLNLDEVQHQPWSAETLLALSSFFLNVPARPGDDDEEALEAWLRDWGEPAERLHAATITLSPKFAWERVDLTMRYMGTPGSPSWWQRVAGDPRGWRKTKAPITLRHVADHYLEQYEDFQSNDWFPSETTLYDGPMDYSGGYGGYGGEAVVVADPSPAGDGIIEAVVGAPAGDENEVRQASPMSRTELVELANEIYQEYPLAPLVDAPYDNGNYLGLRIGPGPTDYFDLDWEIWHAPTEAERALIVQGLAYGQELAAERAQSEAPPAAEENAT